MAQKSRAASTSRSKSTTVKRAPAKASARKAPAKRAPAKKSSSLKKTSSFRLKTAVVFGLLFAAVGAFFLFRSQAAVAVDQNLFGMTNNGGSVGEVTDLKPAWFRMPFTWASEQGNGSDDRGNTMNQNFEVYGNKKGEALTAKSNGIKVMGLLAYTPKWAQGDACPDSDIHCAPDPVKYGRYARAMAAYYSQPANGGIRHWELWNEPNQPGFWTNPNVAKYTAAMKAAYAGIKAADPGATVISGGMAGGGGGAAHIDPRDFLRGIYNNGGGNSFDALGHHPYTYSSATDRSPVNLNGEAWRMMYEEINGKASLHQILIANGDGARPVWITEYGVKAPHLLKNINHTITERDAADYIKLTYSTWDSITTKNGAPFNTGPVFWFTYNFRGTGTGEEQLSITRDSGSAPRCQSDSVDSEPVAGTAAKPAYCAYKNYPRSNGPVEPPPPENTPPNANIVKPAVGATVKETALVTANVSDNVSVAKVEFYVDGNLKGTKPVGKATASVDFFFATRQVANGNHTLTVKAYDGPGLVTTRSISVNVQNAAYGLTGRYYDWKILDNLKLTRVDPEVNFRWFIDSPHPSIDPDRFSVRWTGKVVPSHTQQYTFYTRADDGTRLWVNGRLLIDKWTDHAPTEYSGTINLTAGQQYDIKLEYYENYLGSVVELLWSSPNTPKAIIPSSALRSQ